MITPILSSLGEEKIRLFEKCAEILEAENKKFNLTAITGREEIFVKHFEDSLLGAELIRSGAGILDIGSGAGFPAIPLKIADPSINITLTDSVGKKTAFLVRLLQALNIDGNVIHARVEDLAALNHSVSVVCGGNVTEIPAREYYRTFPSFDYTVCRAVAAFPTLIEYCLPYLKIGGTMLAYKAADIEEELRSARNALRILGGEYEKTFGANLTPDIQRNIICIKKVRQSPLGYPRGGNKPRLKPL